MFDPESVYLPRGKALSSFAYVEQIVSTFIAKHYSPAHHKVFLEEVLEDDYFGFELKKRLLYKVLKNHYSVVYSSFPKKELDRLQNLRNLIAHGVLAARVDAEGKAAAIFRHQGKDYSIDDSFKEWNSLDKIVNAAVDGLPGLNLIKQPGLEVY